MFEQPPLERPRVVVGRQPVPARLVQRPEHLAVHVELQLVGRRVAEAHRLRASVAGQMHGLPLGRAPAAVGRIQHLQLRRMIGDRAHEPVAPARGFVAIAAAHQRTQREARIAQPAEPVVPVALAAEALGSELVGAATMPPVRTLDSSFTVISARSIASRCGPFAALQSDQPRQNACVSCNDA